MRTVRYIKLTCNVHSRGLYSLDPNTSIRSKLQAEQSTLDRIQRRQLKWYEHLLRMEDSRWPNKIYQWRLYIGRRRGRPQQSWKNQVMDLKRIRNIEEVIAENRHLLAFRNFGMDTSLEWKIVVGKRRFASWHHTVGGEEEERSNHGKPSDGLHEKQKHGRRYGRK